MKTSIIIPVYNEAPQIPALLKALSSITKKKSSNDVEIIFIDNGSTDGGFELLEAANLVNKRVLKEPRKGFAEPLNRGVAEARGEYFLFLDADAIPDPLWVKAMQDALQNSDFVVGQTSSLPVKKLSPYGKLSAKLFSGHSERTAHAQGHALPWGPTCNLGVRRTLMEKTGAFSSEATSAFDIDWCWRALLQGGSISYCKAAKVQHLRRNTRRELLEQFERYGLGEAWLHRTYSFLLSPEDQSADPLLSAVNAFQRLRHHSEAAKTKALQGPLEEVAAAFAGGVRLGYERAHRHCPLDRSTPASAIAWRNSAKSMTLFVPGKGITQLEGNPLKVWEAISAGMEEADLVKLFSRLFKASPEEAAHVLIDFRKSLTP